MRSPIIVAGDRVDATSAELELRTRTDEVVHVPALDAATVDRLLAQPRGALADVPLHEICAFLHNVGHNWKSKEYTRRRIYERHLVRYYGYSEKMAETEANWIALLLSSHYRIYDTLSAELGSWHMVDSWVAREEAYVRAMPRGRALHIIPGNVPLSCIASVIRAIATKNVSIVKAASDDPMTPLALALSFMDTDPLHPVAKALSVVYWKGGAEGELERRLLADSDVVCAWGGEAAIEWAKRNAPAETEVLTFGPRRSVAVVGKGGDRKKAARALAHDVAMYDQRACFSVQRVFVEGPVDDFVAEVKQAFALYETLLPKGKHDFDERAGYALAHLEAEFFGNPGVASEQAGWAIVVRPPDDGDATARHPLGRTLYVHPVDHASAVLDHVGPGVQTVAVYPSELALPLRDALARKGVSRIVELGLNNVFRVGGAHDGMYPTQRLVRLVSMELPASVAVKGIVVPIDQTTFLEQNRFVEFIP
ncbi:MAG TPA: aldehyde dehydrogenase family protein [Kofleriaceae bacterium]|nr:aldehyde dehydrogenase family protein [Kofleriaceae bacterium]